ncbi:MAG: TldD/PmbA family protein [Eubacteriales bacterium]|nr:TldD/PmbA family protein [Eubacteriales bacterium]
MQNEFMHLAKEYFAKGASTELRVQRNRTRRTTLLKGNLVRNIRSESKGLCARVYKDGMYGFASSTDISKEAIISAVNAASENAAFLAGRIQKENKGLAQIESGSRQKDEEIKDLPQQTYIDFMRELDGLIEKRYDRLLSRTISVHCDSQEKIIQTSDGYSANIVLPRSYVYVTLSAEGKDGNPVELFTVAGSGGTFDSNFDDPAKLLPKVDELYEHLMKKAEGVYAKAGKKTCILSSDLAGMLAHEAVGHTVEADIVLGGSVALNLLNKQVASPLVSLVDFAHTAFGQTVPLPVYVDDEGTLAKDCVLIEDGILKNYMVNRELANVFNMEPCGNARAWDFNDEPLVRMRNTFILPGESSLEDMIASIDDGYYLLSSANGQADTTGEFMFGITCGYEIKNGKIGKAILDTTVSGVAFEMLKTVSMVGKDIKLSSSGFCGKKQPMAVSLGGPAIKCEINMGGR